MIVDDDKSILRTFTRVFKKGGFEVETAETGSQAAEKCGKTLFDILLIDFQLPDMNGYQFLQKIGASQPSAVKIMLSGYPPTSLETIAAEESADAYLTKPVSPENLMAVVSEKLKSRLNR